MSLAAELPELTKRIIKILDKVRKVLPHPVYGIVVAALIAFSGRGELLLRSIGMVLIAVWLALDLWAWLLNKAPRSRWTIVCGATASGLMLIVVMVTMWWWLDGKLKDQQEDTYSKLDIQAHSSASGKSGELSMFSIVNGGSTNIANHRVYCVINFEGWSHGTWGGKGVAHVQVVDADVLLKGSGGTETTLCLSSMAGPPPLICADITIEIDYALDTQPNSMRAKELRFVGTYNGHDLTWFGEPVGARGNFCGGPDA
jgi:hypothetical protein